MSTPDGAPAHTAGDPVARDEVVNAAVLVSVTVVGSESLIVGTGGHPGQALVGIAVLVAAPAVALARALPLGDPFTRCVVGTAFSVALTILIATALLYAGAWSLTAHLGCLTAVVILLAAVSIWRRRQP